MKPYFPRTNVKEPYSEVVKCFESLGFSILVDEQEYIDLEDKSKIPALCPGGHGKCLVSIKSLKKGGTCCKKCGKEKAKNTMLEKYGAENPSQVPEFQQKKIDTCLKNRGTEFPSQSKAVVQKMKETNLERYGAENVMFLPEFKEKLKATNMRLYGSEYPLQNSAIKQKAEETNLKKYGAKHVLTLPEFKKKRKKHVKQILV